MAVSEEAVKWAFKTILGRLPVSEDALKLEMVRWADETSLMKFLLQSKEFGLKQPFKVYETNQAEIDAEQWASSSKMRVVIVGNCQIRGIANLMSAMSKDVVVKTYAARDDFIVGLRDGTLDITPFIDADLVLDNSVGINNWVELLEGRTPNIRGKIKHIPSIIFTAYHPDCIQIRHQGKRIECATGQYNSSLVFYGWKMGLSREKTLSLFSTDVYELLGFFNYWNSAVQSLIARWESSGLSFDNQISRWSKQGCWMHSTHHPKLYVLADVACAALAREGIQAIPHVEHYLDDDLAIRPCWSVYPEIGKALGISDLSPPYFKKAGKLSSSNATQLMLSLDEFVHQSFDIYNMYKKEDFISERLYLNNPAYQNLDKFLKKKQQPKPAPVAIPTFSEMEATVKTGNNPYQELPDYQFWRRAIEQLNMKDVDPVVRSNFTLNKADKVATAGSCFAQHISRTLQKQGFNYYVSEQGDANFSSEEAQRHNFGIFSARFGNLYTARQLVQLFDRAYGRYSPADKYWVRGDGKFVDPFRPQVEPEGFTTVADLENDKVKHFAAVREMFENLDVFVFTLGLTEAWRSRLDGAVFPLAPGVVAGVMDPSLYEFVNFNVPEVVADMQSFIKRLLEVNPQARMLVTVSPVPLIATYENRHVLVSTTYSKSVLRSAAEEICRHNTMCEYFPSYEIITGNYTKGEYFESDLRSVKPEGVEHVMSLFLLHYASETTGNNLKINDLDAFALELMKENARLSAIICDEEALDDVHCG